MDVRKQVCAVIEDVLAAEKPHFNPVKLLAVGCSSSEIVGGSIGHDSTYQVGEEVAQAILDKAARGSPWLPVHRIMTFSGGREWMVSASTIKPSGTCK